jgi:hypothetical protein
VGAIDHFKPSPLEGGFGFPQAQTPGNVFVKKALQKMGSRSTRGDEKQTQFHEIDQSFR